MSPPLVDATTALSSTILCACAAAVTIANAAFLAPRLFCLPRSKALPMIPTGSPLRYLAIRHQMLFLAVLLLLPLAIDYPVYLYSLLWSPSLSPTVFAMHRGIIVLCMIPSSACVTVATCQRCAVIVTHHPRTRALFLRAAGAIALVSVLGSWILGFMELARVLALDPPLSDADWFEWDFIPLWVSYAITLLPILSIVGTAWSLRHSLMRSGSKNRSGSLNNNNNNSTMPTPLALVSAIGAPAPVAVPRDRSISQSIVDLPSSARRALLSSLSKIRSPAPSDGTLPDDPSSPPVVGAVGGAGLRPPARRDDGEGSCHSELAVRVRHSRVKYPLTATFVVLSVLVIVFWTVGVAVTISSSIGPLRTTAIVVLAQALELTAESSFEFLLRFSRSSASPQQNQHWRQQKQQQRRTSAAPSFTPSPEELQRRESNFVQSSPFTASVISWTSPDPQQAAAATDLEASSPLSWTDPPI